MTFRCGGHDFAFDILQLQRILRYEAPSPLPDAPDFLEGVLPYEGGAVPIVDLRKRLGLPATVTEETRVMLLELDGHRIGVVVDAARELVRVDSTTISAPPPMVRGLAARYIAGHPGATRAHHCHPECTAAPGRRRTERPAPSGDHDVSEPSGSGPDPGSRASAPRTPTLPGGWTRLPLQSTVTS